MWVTCVRRSRTSASASATAGELRFFLRFWTVRCKEAHPCLLSRCYLPMKIRFFNSQKTIWVDLESDSDLESQNFIVHLWACDMKKSGLFSTCRWIGIWIRAIFQADSSNEVDLVWKHPHRPRREGWDLVTAEKNWYKQKNNSSYSDFWPLPSFPWVNLDSWNSFQQP